MTLGQGNLLNNRYRVIEILGRGGMGAVYRAMDESLGVEVALKENLFTTDDYARQFRMEAIILAGIRHPNLPRVTDHFIIDETGQYLVMDYIDGDDLRQRMDKHGPISEGEAVRIGSAACDALSYLHSRKPPILHRDIKLGNIKIDSDGQVYLVDFGLAKMGWEHEETMTGARAMTPGYSPPEQYGSARTDARSDIYSLGATLYAALTGVIPEDSLMRAVDGVKLTPLREHRPDVTARMANVIEKALETSSANRYQSADAFKRAILGQPEPRIETEKIGDDQPAKTQAPDKLPTKKSTSFWRLFGFFLVMLIIVSGSIWFNPRNQSLLQNRFFPVPGTLPKRTSLPPGLPSVTASSTPTVLLTPTQSITAIRTLTITQGITRSASATPSLPAAAIVASANPVIQTTTPSISPSPAVAPLDTPTGVGHGEIAYASAIDHIAQIYILSPGGTNLRQLTNIPAGACNFDWSPDGNQIVYISPCTDRASQYPKSALYVLNIETGETRPLPFKPAGDFEPVWSPDGEKIAFTSLRDGSMQIFVFNLSDFKLTRLTTADDNSQSRYPSWSPDSSQIAYTVLRFGLLQIWSMSADGNNKQQLLRTGGASCEYLPTWSADGESLFFSQTNNSLTAPSALGQYIFQTQTVNLLPIPRPVVDASLSPDGQWVAYETTDTINQDIYFFNLTDNLPQRLTSSTAIDFDPVWRPGH